MDVRSGQEFTPAAKDARGRVLTWVAEHPLKDHKPFDDACQTRFVQALQFITLSSCD
jgi:propanediol dehydratase small subunit